MWWCLEVIKFRHDHEEGYLKMGLVSLQEEEETPEHSLSLPYEDTVRKGPSASQEGPGHEYPSTLISIFPPFRTVRNNVFCLSHQSKVFCYGNLSIQIQTPYDSQIKYYPSGPSAMRPGFMDHNFLWAEFTLQSSNFFQWIDF